MSDQTDERTNGRTDRRVGQNGDIDLLTATVSAEAPAQRFRPPQKNNGQKSQNYILLASGSPH